MPDGARPPTTRLAPSPTGSLHLGHARTFLAAWAIARARGGRVAYRTEDLDGPRCRPEHADAARRDLAWLGLDWDGPELVQSADLEPYRAAARRLLAAERAYACTCSRRAIEAALSAPHASGGELRYPGTCDGRYADPDAAERESGAPAGVRFRVPPGRHAVDDALAGRFEAEPAAECGDFLLLRRDGLVAYQLAVVVDDARQGVDLVVRGDDLLPSAVRQALLADALGLARPAYAHVPLVVDEAGRRLSKRDGDLTLAELRARGADPRAVVAWCAESLGVALRRELPTAAELAPELDLARVPRTPARLDAAALARLRGRA